jgi:hypothetical protein
MAENPLPEGDDGLAIFYRFMGNTFAFVEDLRVPSNKGGAFHKAMLETHFYRSGGSVIIMCQKGMMVVTDERSRWKKPFPVGLAQHSQGHDLALAARAESDQEVRIYSLTKEKVQYIPQGIAPVARIDALDCDIVGHEVVGELTFHSFFVNELEKAYECRLLWDITHLDIKTYSVFYEEDLWYLGGRPLIPVWVIDLQTGKDIGFFAGQQGFVEDGPNWNLHPSVADLCGQPMPTRR